MKNKQENIKYVTSAAVAAEALAAGIDPAEFAKRINENLERKALSAERNAGILEEAHRAGVNVFDPKERDRVLKIHETSQAKNSDQDSEQEAQEFFKKLKADRPNSTITLDMVRETLIKERKQKEKARIKQIEIQRIVREMLIAGPAVRNK